MRIALRFWIHLLAWTGILLAVFTLLDQVALAVAIATWWWQRHRLRQPTVA
jgi:hypothetical protein